MADALARLLAPRSVAVIGASARPGALAANVIGNLDRFGFRGPVHLVGRGGGEIAGRPVLDSAAALPEGVDAAVLILPAPRVRPALEACARRGVRAALVLSAGFAETGPDGLAEQEALAATARAAGMALIGPNCLGLANFADGVVLTFEPLAPVPPVAAGVAIVTQSGAMMGNLRMALQAKGVPVSLAVSTGNEAVTTAEEILARLVEDPRVTTLAVFVERIKCPRAFLDAAARARALGKPVVMMHPGRSERARRAALTHTGAMAGDHAVMAAFVRTAGVVLVDGFDALFDVVQLLDRTPGASVRGLGVVTNSGAVRGVALDLAADLGVALPEPAPATRAALHAVLPEFAQPDNPLDITAQGMARPALFGETAAALLADPGIDALLVAAMGGGPSQVLDKWHALRPVLEGSGRPVMLVFLGDGHPMPDALMREVAAARVPFLRSLERAMRALAHLAPREARDPPPPDGAPADPRPWAEHRGKALLRAAGLPVPPGGLARDLAEARRIAARIGWPVALKAQAASLTHKTEAGGVRLALADPAALAGAWDEIAAALARSRPGLVLDGMLVEAALPRPGAELILAARRDPDWGAYLAVGLGGVFAEVLGELRLIPAGADAAEITAGIRALRGARILDGFRGTAPLALPAAAGFALGLLGLLARRPDLAEIEVNPLAVYPDRVVALDVLVSAGRDGPAGGLSPGPESLCDRERHGG